MGEEKAIGVQDIGQIVCVSVAVFLIASVHTGSCDSG